MKISELQKSNPELYCTDKFSDHSYADFYDELFEGKENSEMDVLEVGVYKGGSIRLWHDYLKKADILGVDVNPAAITESHGLTGRANICICDAYNGGLADDDKFDVIIDDGSHTLEHQIYAIQNFPKLLKPCGVLVIEDVPKYSEAMILSNSPDGGSVEVINLRHIKNRWDDCLIVFTKNHDE